MGTARFRELFRAKNDSGDTSATVITPAKARTRTTQTSGESRQPARFGYLITRQTLEGV